ncbi:FxSxx-COOH system tetratricopeptide repeat protein [Streptomyces sp. NPDC001480]|uniref:FxSxx-COOH system tetratricopeptide repeat protein n=1 Tax=Streptomyces sp. NPDC001480 TaxID=3364577 RepID=UPI0036AD83D2
MPAGTTPAISASNDSIAAGEIGQVNQYAAPRPPARWPHQVGTPPPAAAYFQHRAEITELAEALAGGGAAVLGQAAPSARAGLSATSGAAGVVAGLGGVGKSQLAAHYARSAMEDGEVDVLVWVTAATKAAVVGTYADAAAQLIGSAAPEDPELAAEAFLAWLAPKAIQPRCRWLIVLDDLADPTAMRGLWPPPSPTGRTLVTTRRQDPALLAGRHLITVGVFSPGESRAYLAGVLDRYGLAQSLEELDALAGDLGHLPLALAQAAAYIGELADTGMTPTAYRRLLADRTTALRDTAPSVLPDEQSLTVAATWSLSIEHADTLRPAGLARPMLNLAAFLDPNGIPGTVLTSIPARVHLAHHRTADRPSEVHTAISADQAPALVKRRGLIARFARRAGTNPAAPSVTDQEARAALSALRRLSLIEHTPNAPATAVRIHQLVQRAVRDTLDPEQHQPLARTAADALLTAWPDVERDTALAAALRANTTALADKAGDSLYRPDVHSVLYRAGHSLDNTGQVTAACDYFHHLTIATTLHLGPDHPDTLAAQGSLASCRGKAGDAAGAAAATAELLKDQLRVQGPDHPDTLTTRMNLASWRGEAGDAAGAAAAFAELLKDRLRVQGRDDPDTLTTRHNLASWRGEAGDAAGAAAAFAELLKDRLRVQGPDHPGTITTRNSLASWRGEAGDAAGAAAAFAELLKDRLRVQGPDHPDTLTTRHNLASCRARAGDAAGAAAAFAELLKDRLRVLGPDHPDTLTTRMNLAYLRGKAGDAAGAAAATAELLKEQLRVLGPDHPDTLTTRMNLAYLRGEAGDAAGAAAATAELLKEQLRVQGPDHPDTLTTRRHLARWRGEAGDVAGAGAATTQLLKDQLRVLGPEHPDIFTTRNHLAFWQARAGDVAGAAAAFAELLKDRLRVLGPDHPDIFTTRMNLAYLRGEAGDAAGAAAATAELLKDQLRVLGPDHPDTLTTRNDLAHWRGEAGDAAGAVVALADLLDDCLRVLGSDHAVTLTTRRGLAHWRSLLRDAGVE